MIPTQPSAFHRVLRADPLSVRQTLADLRRSMGDSAGDMLDRMELVLAEALNNVVEHGIGPLRESEASACEAGPCGVVPRGAPAPRTVHLMVQPSQTGLTCTISDNGVVLPGHCLAPRGLPSHDRGLPEGGFGWYLIQDLVSELHYARQGDRNCLTFTIPRHGKRIIAA